MLYKALTVILVAILTVLWNKGPVFNKGKFNLFCVDHRCKIYVTVTLCFVARVPKCPSVFCLMNSLKY